MDSLPCDCGSLVFRFLTLGDLLATRACSRALRNWYDPGRAPHVWRAVRPAMQLVPSGASEQCALLLLQAYRSTPAELYERGLFVDMCRRGYLMAAQWLTEHYELTAIDIRLDDNRALRGACQYGQTEMAQWLTECFGLVPADARALDNWALRYACGCGHLATAQWLVGRFKLTAKDARARDSWAMDWVRSAGSAEMVLWLTGLMHSAKT